LNARQLGAALRRARPSPLDDLPVGLDTALLLKGKGLTFDQLDPATIADLTDDLSNLEVRFQRNPWQEARRQLWPDLHAPAVADDTLPDGW
jgi:hypothetical protein